MQINYITYDSWWDTDVTVLPDLAKNFNVNAFCLSPVKGAKYPTKELPSNISFSQVCQRYRDRDPRSFFVALKYFAKCFLRHHSKDDIYFVIPGKNPYFLFLMLCFFPKSRTIISSHNYLEHGDNKSLGASLGNKLKEKIYRKFRLFHFFSKQQNDLFKKDFPYKKSFYTDMPPKDFGDGKQVERKDSKVVLLFFGLIRDYKRLDLLIGAINRLENPNIKVVIAGHASDSDIKKYTNMIRNKELFDLRFGFVKNEDIANYFVNSDFLVLPYESATQSGPSLVAVNYGIPVIASSIPAFEDHIKNGVNGFLFENGSEESLSDLICKISQMKKDDILKMKNRQMEYKIEYIKANDINMKFKESFKMIGFVL